MQSQPSVDEPRSAAEQFFAKATLGLNQWWRWVVGLLVIIVIAWLGLGVLILLAGCGVLNRIGALGVSCGESMIAELALSGLVSAIGLAGVWLVARTLHRKPLKQFLSGRTRFDGERYLFGVLAALVISALTVLVNRFILQWEMTFQAPDWGFLVFLLFAIVLVPIQAGFEEVLFRAYIMQGLMQFLRNKLVLALAAGIIFALPHLANPEPWAYGIAPYLTDMVSVGFFFGIVTLLDGGIELAAGYHAMNNLFVDLVATTEVAVTDSPSLFLIHLDRYELFPDVFVTIVGLAVALALLSAKYRWFRRTPAG